MGLRKTSKMEFGEDNEQFEFVLHNSSLAQILVRLARIQFLKMLCLEHYGKVVRLSAHWARVDFVNVSPSFVRPRFWLVGKMFWLGSNLVIFKILLKHFFLLFYDSNDFKNIYANVVCLFIR